MSKKNKIALLGFGKTNKAILENGKKHQFDIYDDSFENKYSDENGNNFYPSSYFKKNQDKYKKQIITPGISPSNPIAKNATHIISEYDYFRKRFPFCIWVSGTNGKTTLTQMIYHLLGDISQMGANIGTPIATMDKKKSIWILETSSFTMHYTNRAYPNIYLLLPINDDHLSWHGSFEEYQRAKLKPLSMMDNTNIAILPECYKNIKTQASTIYYRDEFELAQHMGIDIKKVKIKRPFTISAILALSVQKILFDKADISLCNTFTIDAHKMQVLKDKKDRTWIDDSKATNISATIEAIKAYENKKIFIILGGDSKQVSLEPLIKFIQKYDISIYAIGSSANEIQELSQIYKAVCTNCQNIQKAIKLIDKKLDNSSIAILSPACASLDQFASYKERGEVFQKEIYNLKK